MMKCELKKLITLLLIPALCIIVQTMPLTAMADSNPEALPKSKWTTTDTTLEITWQVLHFIDWGTTLDMASQPGKYIERNPILGEHPSRSEVNIYMGAWAVIHPAITYLLPNHFEVAGLDLRPRRVWQAVTIITSGYCASHNLAIGLQIDF